MKFAITGTGNIAHRFASALNRTDEGEIYAILSRDPERGRAFAAGVNAPGARIYCDIEEMLDDPEIEAVYIGTPNNMHLPQTIAALHHHKPVICEKPMCMTEKEALTAMNVARQCDTLLMEAFWTRTMPAYKRAKQWIAEGRIGKLRSIHASFCFHSTFDPASRLYNPQMGGGALFDVGVYGIGFAMGIMDAAPDGVQGMLHFCENGIDDYDSMQLRFGDVIATLQSGVCVNEDGVARIYGDNGSIALPTFWGPRSCKLFDNGSKLIDEFNEPMPDDLYYEALHFIDCVKQGLKESPVMPLCDSLEFSRIYDLLLSGRVRN